MNYALIPQIYHSYKLKEKTITYQTSLLSSGCMYLGSYAQYTLDLDMASISTLASGIMWNIITYQSFKYDKSKKTLEDKLD